MTHKLKTIWEAIPEGSGWKVDTSLYLDKDVVHNIATYLRQGSIRSISIMSLEVGHQIEADFFRMTKLKTVWSQLNSVYGVDWKGRLSKPVVDEIHEFVGSAIEYVDDVFIAIFLDIEERFPEHEVY